MSCCAEIDPHVVTSALRCTRRLPAVIYRIALTPQVRVEFVNDFVEELTGYAPEMLYESPNLLSRLLHTSHRNLWRHLKQASPQARSDTMKLRLVHREGKTIWTEQRFCVVRDKSQNAVAVEGIGIDITAQQDLISELARQRNLLAEAQRIAKIGNWEWDVVNNHLWWSDEIFRIFDIEPNDFRSCYESFTELIHPEDRKLVESAINRALVDGKSYSIHHRILLPNGNVKIIHERAEVECDPAGQPLRMVGTAHDVTDKQMAERAQRATETKLGAIVRAMPDLIFSVSADGTFLDFHRPNTMKLAIPPEDFLGRKVGELFPPDFTQEAMARIQSALATGRAKPLESEMEVDGEQRYFEARYVPIASDEVLAIVRDVTDSRAAAREIEQLKVRLEQENFELRQEARAAQEFESTIGENAVFKACLHAAHVAAPTVVPVLLLGETGTGKELIAKAIHNLSDRHEQPLVSINCAALPEDLIESELFGHEKGAFTGATSRRIGKFEAADGGTLFLDEIGDLPLKLQAKLLRVIQDNKFQRLGGTRTMQVDVRLLLATNRDLLADIETGRFRADLYYRISTFPIHLPPLRERKGDIALLAQHFVDKHSRHLDRKIRSLSPELLTYIERQSWPGNVRELEGFIVRAMISASGNRLELLTPQDAESDVTSPESAAAGRALTMAEAERSHILKILNRTHWQITGKDGAAQILNLPASTLRSRMKRLDIRRPQLRTFLSNSGSS